MGISFRHYLFSEDGSLRRIPQRLAEALAIGRDTVPEYAGTTQRVAYVVVELDRARPVRILDARGRYWRFDESGSVDGDLRRQAAALFDAAYSPKPDRRAPVVDLVPEIKRREIEERSTWTLTADELDRIAMDLWPGIDGPAPDVTTVKGKAPRRPPLTGEARWALKDIATQVGIITDRLGDLSERALKGLAFEARRMGSIEDEAMWRGVADAAERQCAIRAAHRTGRGEWYAVVDVTRQDPNEPDLRDHVTSAHMKCANRKKAVEAGRKLMAEKAGWLSEGTFVEVSLCSALEWRAGEGE